MAYNPNTQREDPNYVAPVTKPALPPAGLIGTTSLSQAGNNLMWNQPAERQKASGVPQIGAISQSQTVNASAPDRAAVDTVESRVQGLIGSESPLQQLAKTQAMQQMNDMGLSSSSLAVGAAADAGYRAALPIAIADSGANNTANNNLFAAQQQTNLQNASQGQRTNEFNATSTNQFAMVDKQAESALRQMSAQQQNDLIKLAQTQGYNIENMTLQQVNDLQKAAVLQGYDLTKMDKAAADQLQLLDASTLADMEKLAQTQGYNLETMDAKQINDLAMLSETNKAANDLLAIEQDYKQKIQTSANAATMFNSYAQQVAVIQTSPNITGDSTTPDPDNPARMLSNKEVAIMNLRTLLKDGMAAQEAVTGLDINALVFGPEAAGTPGAATIGTVDPITGLAPEVAPAPAVAEQPVAVTPSYTNYNGGTPPPGVPSDYIYRNGRWRQDVSS